MHLMHGVVSSQLVLTGVKGNVSITPRMAHRCSPLLPTRMARPVGRLRGHEELQKKLVKNNGFWRINAIRPKTKAKRGRMRKYENEGNAKLRGLMRKLGF